MPYRWMFALNQDGRQKGHEERTEIEITLSNLTIPLSQKNTSHAALLSCCIHNSLCCTGCSKVHNKICIEPTYCCFQHRVHHSQAFIHFSLEVIPASFSQGRIWCLISKNQFMPRDR